MNPRAAGRSVVATYEGSDMPKVSRESATQGGDYGVVVTGYDNDAGDFDLRARLEDAPSLESVCSAAHPAAIGAKTTELIGSEGSNFSASCGNASSGSEEKLAQKASHLPS